MDHRDFDSNDDLEVAILDELGSEGVVLGAFGYGEPARRNLVLCGMVAGAGEPDLVVAAAWHGTQGAAFVRVQLRCPLSEALRRHLSSTGEVSAVPIDDRDPGDVTASDLVGGSAKYLARYADTSGAGYLFRVGGSSGAEKRIAFVGVELDRGVGVTRGEVFFDRPFSEMLEFADAEFGAARPRL